MDRILVGDAECSYLDVCNYINASDFALHLYRNMGLLALQLGVPPGSCLETEQQLILQIRPHFTILHDLLVSWRAALANRATLENLIIALENVGLAQLGGLLYANFQPVAKRQRRCKYSTAPVDLGWFMSQIGNILILCSPDPTIAYERILENSFVRITDLKNDQDLLMFNGQSSQTQIFAVQTSNVMQLFQHSYQIASKILLITTENCQALLQQYSDFLHVCGALIFEEKFSWSDLTDEYKNELLRNCQYLQNIDANLIENTIVGNLFYDFIKTPELGLSDCTIPEPIKYYIPRRILSRNIMSSDIFKIKSDHIFLFSGIKRHELSNQLDGKLTDTSSSQKSQPQLTVNFIFLETKLDYEAIASKTNRAVHWFHKENDEIIWVQSTGGLFEIQRFVEETSQNPFFDNDFLQKIEECKLTDKKKFPVCISDTPGMGKTILLAQIARQLAVQGKIVIFIVISEFLVTLKKKWGKNIPSEKNQALLEILISVYKTDLEKKLVEMNLKCNETKVELLFDGLDEARSEDLLLIYDCFREISSWKSTRMWVTTRPHLLHALENELNVFGYNIAAFDIEDQHHFLERYWHHKNPQLNKGKLQKFAERCLIILKNNMTDQEQDIAGVPLQCLLIAEVFQQEVVNYSTPDNSLQADSYIPSIQIKSISDLYKRLVKLKFQKYFDRYSIHGLQVQESDLENIHIHMSLLLLFPNRVKTFNAFLKKNSNLTTEDVFKVGILESATVIPIPRFIHRTFAEYFIAVLVVNVLKQGGVKPMPHFLLEEVLKNTSIKFDINSLTKWKVEARSIKHKVISYFIDNMLSDIKSNDMHISLLQQNPKPNLLSNLLFALVYENHQNIFKLLQVIFQSALEKSQILTQMVVYVAIHRCYLPFIKIVCNSLNGVDQVILHTLLDNAAFPCSVLDIAASRGSFKIVEYLVNVQNFKVTIENGKAECLLHHLLHQSKFDDEPTIIDKVTIMKYLKTKNFSHFEHEFEGKTPLFSENAHFKLILEMIKLEVNLLVTDDTDNTILHLAPDYLSPSEYCQLIDTIPKQTFQKLIQMKSKSKLTPLHAIIKHQEFDATVLSPFSKNGADFSASTEQLETPLETAVKSNRTLCFLTSLRSMGAGTCDKREQKFPLLRIAIEVGNLDAVKMCIELGYDVNQRYNVRTTPLSLALRSKGSSNLDIVEQLISAGAQVEDGGLLNMAIKNSSREFVDCLLAKKEDLDFFHSDSSGNTPLHNLLSFGNQGRTSEMAKILNTLLENKLDVNIPNKWGSSPLVHALESGRKLNITTLELLEKHGASVETYDFKNGKPFLNTAIENGATDLIDWLISKQADVNASDSDGNTPLHKLLLHCKDIPEVNKIMSRFVENKLDVNIHNKQGISPLVYALKLGRKLKLSTLELLEKHGAVVETHDFKNSKPFLNTAIANGATDVIDWLISKQADVNASDSNGNTPLHILLYYCWEFKDMTVKITQNLIEHQANVNIKNNNGKSPLLYALDIGSEPDINTVELLERHGAVEGSEIATKLISQVLIYKEKFHNDTYLKIFSACVKNGADITIDEKRYLLYELVRDKCIPGVKYLLLQGWDTTERLLHTHSYSADSLSVNDDKELQIDFSHLNHGIENSEYVDKRVLLRATMLLGTIEAVKSLYELDYFKEAFKEGDLLFIAAKRLPVEKVKFMCDCYIRETGKSIISLEVNGSEKSLLHAAINGECFLEVSKYLLESHVLDVHLKESRMRDLVHVHLDGTIYKNFSLVKEIIEVLEMLIKRDASLLYEADEEGRTPLQRKGIHINVLEWLINHGANKYAVDKNGNGVLQVVSESNWLNKADKDKLTKILK